MVHTPAFRVSSVLSYHVGRFPAHIKELRPNLAFIVFLCPVSLLVLIRHFCDFVNQTLLWIDPAFIDQIQCFARLITILELVQLLSKVFIIFSECLDSRKLFFYLIILFFEVLTVVRQLSLQVVILLLHVRDPFYHFLTKVFFFF